ncbi:hypothetical protein ACFFQW_15125 [Umezawaea endophytica]|uniref:Uncharacterized protein n=1 Tax=Umezawaea endophytica TaxID=1654476 RepID=A0A9X2VFH4_9PSEU|nr:hypothetical protein [Umezawaea endophytica]MCS7475497.1 hypothetical protein [Umezawaea endophytica]
MTLTSQLDDGALGTWFAGRFPGTGRLVESIATAALRVEPVRSADPAGPGHRVAVDGAFRARLALLVDGAPPYGALFGLVRAGLVSREWADRTAASFPSHRGLDAGRAARGLAWRPTPGGWVDLDGPVPRSSPTRHEPVLSEFFGRLVRYLDGHAAAGILGTPNVEAGFARMCVLLAGWASAELPVALLELHARQDYAVDDLWDLPEEAVVVELAAVAERLRQTDGDPRDRPLELWRGWGHDYAEPAGPAALKRADTGQAGSGLPAGVWGVSAPVLVPRWAEADLLIGSRLLDVRTDTDDPDRLARGLWRLAAHTWLDTTDRYRVQAVGFYLARHGLHVTWDATTFTHALLGSAKGADAARKEFRRIAREVITAEGGHPPRTGLKVPWRSRS